MRKRLGIVALVVTLLVWVAGLYTTPGDLRQMFHDLWSSKVIGPGLILIGVFSLLLAGLCFLPERHWRRIVIFWWASTRQRRLDEVREQLEGLAIRGEIIKADIAKMKPTTVLSASGRPVVDADVVRSIRLALDRVWEWNISIIAYVAGNVRTDTKPAGLLLAGLRERLRSGQADKNIVQDTVIAVIRLIDSISGALNDCAAALRLGDVHPEPLSVPAVEKIIG